MGPVLELEPVAYAGTGPEVVHPQAEFGETEEVGVAEFHANGIELRAEIHLEIPGEHHHHARLHRTVELDLLAVEVIVAEFGHHGKEVDIRPLLHEFVGLFLRDDVAGGEIAYVNARRDAAVERVQPFERHDGAEGVLYLLVVFERKPLDDGDENESQRRDCREPGRADAVGECGGGGSRGGGGG